MTSSSDLFTLFSALVAHIDTQRDTLLQDQHSLSLILCPTTNLTPLSRDGIPDQARHGLLYVDEVYLLADDYAMHTHIDTNGNSALFATSHEHMAYLSVFQPLLTALLQVLSLYDDQQERMPGDQGYTCTITRGAIVLSVWDAHTENHIATNDIHTPAGIANLLAGCI